ncbi:disulfide bond formation DsbB family protein [Collimonas arenae]|uniref:Disulfide bond formation protein B n=1 Tax=Collimonas arenae TaxID=279058 RepID=A0A127QNQ1_9BURK|nr:disulfide bond formation protein B [Collimonas arenae]AMP11671.1 disulfide bond formation DsbB family protein [Collimonas arenae]
MKTSKSVLLIVAFISLAILGAALYLQHVEDMQPCPLCVIQRYAFAAIALVCLVCAGLPNGAQKAGASLGILAGLGGAGTAIWHLWVIAHPSTSCGRDALEAPMNALPPATLLPSVFKVDAFALCTTAYDAILGLSIPQWSLLWFVVLVVILVAALFKRNDAGNRRY